MKQVAWFIGLVVLVFAAILLIRPMLPEMTYETNIYNEFTFTLVEGTWYFDWQKDSKVYGVGLRHGPHEVENVSIGGMLNESFNTRREIYVSFDPEEGEYSRNFTILTLGATELTNNMAKVLKYRPVAACTRNSSVCEGTPIVTCDTPNVSVIILSDVGDPSIELDQDCITLRGSRMGLLRSIDRLLYQWYGVMGERWAK